jgi:hypothetical protein
MIEALIGASHKRRDPNNKLGFGIPDAPLAKRFLDIRLHQDSLPKIFVVQEKARKNQRWVAVHRDLFDKKVIIDFLSNEIEDNPRIYLQGKNNHPSITYSFVKIPAKVTLDATIRLKKGSFRKARVKKPLRELESY